MRRVKEVAGLTGLVMILLAGGYLAVVGMVWQWRNPKANQSTFWSEMPAPLRFERLGKYQ